MEEGTAAGAGGLGLGGMLVTLGATPGTCVLPMRAGLAGRIDDAGVRAATSLERCVSTSSSLHH